MKNEGTKKLIRLALVVLVAFLFGPSPARAQQFGPWSAPVNLNNLKDSNGNPCPVDPNTEFNVNSAFDDSHPAISKDGLSLFFASTRPGPDSRGQVGLGEFDLWVTQRDSLDDCWQPPMSLGPAVNSTFRDLAPNLTTDGHWLYFQSNRPGGCGGLDLWVTHRQDKRDDFGWETPVNLGCMINTAVFDEGFPNYFEDKTSGIHFLYFNRKPIGAPPSSYHIYVSTCDADLATCNTQGLWGAGTPVDALNSPFGDTRTAIRRRDGLEMIFSTTRPGSFGSENLWVSTRATTQDQDWLLPVPINCEWSVLMPPPCPSWAPPDPAGSPVFVDSLPFDIAPALSWDATELYFTSARTDLPGSAGGRDLYVTTRTKLHHRDKDKDDDGDKKD